MPRDNSILSAKASVASATTDGAVITAVTGNKIAVIAVALTQGTAAGAITFNTKPAGAGTAISAAFVPAASATLVLPEGNGPWFVTNAGEGLTVTTGTTTSAVAIQVKYRLVPA